jgi:hypothetical protein
MSETLIPNFVVAEVEFGQCLYEGTQVYIRRLNYKMKFTVLCSIASAIYFMPVWRI